MIGLAARSGGSPRRLPGITASGVGVLVVVAVTVVVGRRLGSRPVLVMAYGLLTLVGLAWLLGRPRAALSVSRSRVPRRVREGQMVEVELGVTARRRVSTVVLEEVLPAQLGGPRRFPVPLLGTGQEQAHSYSMIPARRGRYRVGPLVAEWSDPFGLTRRRTVLDEPVDVIVHPLTETVNDRIVSRAWEDPPMRPPVSKRWPTGFEFYGLRDYVIGDDPRRINWYATARADDSSAGEGRYIVRESEQGITDRVNIFIDSRRSGHSPGETSETFEAAVRVAASLGRMHLREGMEVSAYLNGSDVAVALRGRRTELRLLDMLATVEPDSALLTRSLDRLLLDRRPAHNVVITPHVDRSTAARVRLLAGRGTSLLVVLVLWEDTDPVAVHWASRLPCTVVEVSAGVSLSTVFRNAVGIRR